MAMSAGKIVARSLFPHGINVFKQSAAINGSRFLFTRTQLGLTGYENARANYKKQFTSLEESFRLRMRNFIEKNESVIFSEDLKAMLYIVEKNPEDLDLVMSMIKRYHEQKKQLRFANFTFGPVVMRALYHLDQPDLAFQAFKDPALDEFFNQLTSVQILMDLLWNHGKYEECLEAYTLFTKQPMSAIIFPRRPSILAAAACYKMNTPESLEKGIEMVRSSEEKSSNLPRRTIHFIAALALKQNRPDIAAELSSKASRPTYIVNRCIKLVAFAQLKRFDEIMAMLKQSTMSDNPSGNKLTYFSDAIQQVEELTNQESGPEVEEIKKLLTFMKEAGYVQNLTMEEHLTTEIGDNDRPFVRYGQTKPNERDRNFPRFNEIVKKTTRFGMQGSRF